MRRFIPLLFAAAAGCSSAASVSTGKPAIVATTGMIGDAARIIGGPHVDVHVMMGPGIDPHQYKATAGDLRRMQSAKLVLYNGLHLEGKMADVFESMGKRTKTVAVTHSLNPQTELRTAAEGYEGTHDPHVWFDVSLWMKCVGAVRDALCELDPAHAADFQTNADAYLKELASLHDEVNTKAASIPKERRVLITAHDAFYYFGRAYGFEVRGLQGISTASEPSTRDVQELAKLIGERKLPAIFGETSVPDRNIQAVRDAVTKGYGFEVKFVGERLYSDALGNAGTPAGTYAGMVRHNIDAMTEALK
ncbi:MAG: zinc ABC transporter substrate-binding protein [Gemmataceae bacterium]